ncbi:MAG: UPF0175 family protein [Saprospiraceae bacterium]|nr:UPF0175 family protein [Saprospiraceae bacterium]
MLNREIMVIHLSDELLTPLKMTEADIRLELAIALYASGKLAFGKARALAGLNWIRFRLALSERNIPIHYDQTDFEADLAAVEALSGK